MNVKSKSKQNTKKPDLLLKMVNYAVLIVSIVFVLAHYTRADSKLNLQRINNPGGEFLRPLLIPRAPGTTNHKKVQAQIKAWFGSLGWHEQIHEFIASTPNGPIPMANLVFTKNPLAAKRIVLAAHYDSKIKSLGGEDYQFVGATDSALPCAQIVELCYALNDSMQSEEFTLQAVFFDGEEAFDRWTEDDSLYGSRHLANLWHSGSIRMMSQGPPQTYENMHLFILLDLLGAPRPRIATYSKTTEPHFLKLVQIEERLEKEGAVHKDANTRGVKYFHHSPRTGDGIYMLDDHAPFHRLGFRRILHLIPSQFPSVWHKIGDNGNALDAGTINDLTLILFEFLQGLFINE